MKAVDSSHEGGPETPVDEVRRVREHRDRKAGGDIHKLVEQSRRTVEKFRKQLKLKVVAPPPPDTRRDGAAG